MQPSFASITISYLIHSTEDEALLNSMVLSAFDLSSSEISVSNVEGHFGNKLILVKAHLVGERAQDVASKISAIFSDSARAQISENIEKSMDEHDALFLRLDRQSLDRAFNLNDEEPIKIKLKPKFRRSRSEMIRSYLEMIREK